MTKRPYQQVLLAASVWLGVVKHIHCHANVVALADDETSSALSCMCLNVCVRAE